MATEYDQIYFTSQDSHRNPLPLIKNSSFQIFQIFQEDHHEFCDPIDKGLEQPYLARFVVNNKF